LNPNIHIHRTIRREDHRVAAVRQATGVDAHIVRSPVF
jgi:hypothetical protein